MELKSVFEIVKADRYSQEGCEKIAAETEDKIYKTGEISTATGLQKQPDGSWAPPKNGAGPVKGDKKKADKERAERSERADQKASAARAEAEKRKLSGPDMKDFFLAKSYEGFDVGMAQRGLEAQGFDLLEANDKINVYRRPEGGRITMQLEGNKIKSADYQTPEETRYADMDTDRLEKLINFKKKNESVISLQARLHPKDDYYRQALKREIDARERAELEMKKREAKADQTLHQAAAQQPNNPAKQKHYSFVKAGHHYRVPASSPAEAVQLLKSRGVKGFKESDAFDEGTPRTPAPEDAAPDHTYTQQSINGWREMTGDTKIRIKK